MTDYDDDIIIEPDWTPQQIEIVQRLGLLPQIEQLLIRCIDLTRPQHTP